MVTGRPIRRRPLDAALAYARRGWPVFPCHSPAPRPGGCSCGRADCASPAKHPRVAGGLKAATTDDATVRTWWARWPSANVAVRTGRESGLFVVDVDPDHGGEESLERLVALHGPLPPGRAVRTGSGGLHLHFAHPGGVVRNSAGTKLGAGLDVRGDGGYVVAPPSRHSSGGLYAAASGCTTVPRAPTWLLGRILTPERSSTEPRRVVKLGDARQSSWAQAAVVAEATAVLAAAQGSRNATLNRAAFRLGQIVGGGALDRDEVGLLLVESGLAAGLGRREVELTVASGLRAGEQSPRYPAARSMAGVATALRSKQERRSEPGAVRARGIDLRTLALPGRPGHEVGSYRAADGPHPADQAVLERELPQLR